MDENRQKILLVDDEPDILEFIRYNLEKEEYEVKTASNGRDALQIAKSFHPDLIILDVMMPEMDGIETCHELRKMEDIGNTLITFLTARNEDYTLIAGLESGADDYITKPIKPRVLVSRVKALLRRRSLIAAHPNEIKAGPITIDLQKYLVSLDGQPMELPKKEFDLLFLLASAPGKVFKREEILSSVWGNDVIVGERTIDVHIRKLREKLGEHLIRTVKGVGYKFEF
ncbi:MAG: response regulator transcription factor [Flavobacteriales bacterium]|nr:response regulator transcription factor [Flavobacteriales bacterium]MCB9446842.1 response regulator transcription factor [Flavobacteriales bacterium]